jgi:hypothetical protein
MIVLQQFQLLKWVRRIAQFAKCDRPLISLQTTSDEFNA